MSDLMHTAGVASRPAPQADGQAANAAGLRAPWSVPHRGADEASDLLKRLFRGFDGSFALRLWTGTILRPGKAGPDESESRFTRCAATRASFVRWSSDVIVFASRSLFPGRHQSSGGFFAALSLKDHLHSIRLSSRDRLGALLSALRLRAPNDAWPGSRSHPSPPHGRAVKAHSKTENRDAIQFHYDVSNKLASTPDVKTMNVVSTNRHVSTWMLIACGVWLVGLGLYFIVLRPPLLPEDPRFMGTTLAQIRTAMPGLESWLKKVFTVMGGLMASAGVLTVFVATVAMPPRLKGTSWAIAFSGALTVALMSATNFALYSDFRWLLLVPALVWLAGLVFYIAGH